MLCAAAACAVAPEPGRAVGEVRLAIGDIDAGTWNARDVVVRLAIGADSSTVAEVTASRMTLPAGLGSLERVSVSCPQPILRNPEFRCKGARVTGRIARLGQQSFIVDAGFDTVRRRLDFKVAGVKIGNATVAATGNWEPGGWQSTVDTTALAIGKVQELAAPWVTLPEGFQVDGRVRLRVAARGAAALTAADVRATFEELTVNNAAGTLATDKLALEVDARLQAAGADWLIDSAVRSAGGQAYFEPVFLDLRERPLAADLKGRWIGAGGSLELQHANITLKDAIQARARGVLDFSREPLLRSLRIDIGALTFPGAYASLFQPFLLSTELKELTTSGSISGSVEVQAGAPAAVDLALADVSAEDKNGKLGMQGLSGRVIWRSRTVGEGVAPPVSDPAAAEPASVLSWRSAHLYGLAGAAAKLSFVASGAGFRLLEPTLLPIFDGGLAIDTFSVRNVGAEDMSLRFDGSIEPISMRLLSQAFGWPTFGGTIEGRIPDVTLDERVLSFGGDLEARIFGGRVVISGMRLRDPLGTYPRLSADISMRNLDLEQVTGTFSFGAITGLLDADVRGLELFRWRPIRFDARLYTPRGDKTRHVISQRAVSNLANIGGGGRGVAAALQGGVLRFFDTFGYDRLGFSCRLANDVCHMDGVEPVGNGSYYIVKGSGIPRINVIGNANRVNWNRLVGQLQAIQATGGPVVQRPGSSTRQ